MGSMSSRAAEVAVPADEVLTGHELLRLLGPVRDADPLAPEIHEEVQCEGYTRRLVSYDVPSGLLPRSSAFRSTRRAGAPGFCHHQHAGEFDLGKGQACGLRGDRTRRTRPSSLSAGSSPSHPTPSGSRTATGPTARTSAGSAVLPTGEGGTLLADAAGVSLAIDYATLFPRSTPRVRLYRALLRWTDRDVGSRLGRPHQGQRVELRMHLLPGLVLSGRRLPGGLRRPRLRRRFDVEDVLALSPVRGPLITAQDDLWSRGA